MKGKYNLYGGQPVIVVKVVGCDYCGRPVAGWKEKKFPVIINNEVSFTFDSVRYVLQKTE